MKIKKTVSLLLTVVMVLSLFSVFVTAGVPEDCYINDRITHVLAVAPTVDGAISTDEYGAPVIITSQAHANADKNDKVAWVKDNSPENVSQQAKIYMANDGEYLYIAATLDHAQADQSTGSGSGGYRPHLSVTLSKFVDDGVLKTDTGYEQYLFSRVHLEGNGQPGFYGAEFTADLKNSGSNTSQNTNGTVTYNATYQAVSGVYTYEMCIPWTAIPGMTQGGTYSPASLAMTLELADGNKNTGLHPSYYQIGGSASGQGKFNKVENPHGAGLLEFEPGEWCRIANQVAPMPSAAPLANGVLADGEYGDPVVITSQAHAKMSNADAITWTKANSQKNVSQQAKIYMTNDTQYLYIAATLDHAQEDKSGSSGGGGYRPHLAVTASKAVDDGVLKNNGYEQYLFSRVHLQNGAAGFYAAEFTADMKSEGSNTSKSTNGTITYQASYDAVSATYTYEMCIPWTAIPGMTDNGEYNAAPLAITLELADGNKNMNLSPSYYQIGGDAAAQVKFNKTENPHGNQVWKLNLNKASAEDPYVSDVASAGQDITVDGMISKTEWGSAVAVMSSASPNFWNDDKAHGDAARRAKVYLSNDSDYIYVGATLDYSDKGLAYTGTSVWKYPSFIFSLSAWDDTTNVKRINGEEQYTSYRFTLNTDTGVIECLNKNKNITTNQSLSASDYKVIYDAATRTYTHEARIPIRATNIKYAESLDVAFSAQVGCTLYDAAGANDRYNLGLGVLNPDGQTYAHEGENRAVKITLNKPSWLTADNYVKDTVAQKQGDIVIDANVTTQEWGEPVIVTDAAYAKGYWSPNGYWTKGSVSDNADQKIKIYMTNDSKYLYVAATLDHAKANLNADLATYLQPHLALTLSKYDPDTDVVRVNGKEQFTAYRIGWLKGGEVSASTVGYHINATAISKQDWAVTYDSATETYVYELRIPFMTSNINIHETSQIAASIQIGDGEYILGENSSYNIGGTGYAYKDNATKGQYPHLGQSLIMNLRQDYYVKDTASKVPSSLTVDGKIIVDEWGEPIIVANPSYTQENIGDYRTYDSAAKNDAQTARVWMTNDNDYIYVGATLDKSVYQNAGTLSDVECPHFGVDLSQFDADNTFNLKENQEQFTGFVIWLDDAGKKQISVRTQGLEAKALNAEDYAVSYDTKSGTYTYEMRIPYGMTNVNWKSNQKIAFSASLGASYTGVGGRSNRYLFSLGFDGVHKDNALSLTLNESLFVSQEVESFSGAIALDGKVSTSEWGDPIVVTTPDHCKATWNGFWRNDPANIKSNQTVKIYSTNDEEYVYFAATIDEADMCTMEGKWYEKAHFLVTMGRYDEETDMERMISCKKTYERFVAYSIRFEGNTPYAVASGKMVDRVSINEDDWAVSYNAENRTYTYELRIPFAMTTLRYGNDNKMNIGIAVADAKLSPDKAANRYNIGGTGASYGNDTAGNFAHTGQSMMLRLNDNPYTREGAWNPSAELNPFTADISVLPAITLMVLTSGLFVVLCIFRKKN